MESCFVANELKDKPFGETDIKHAADKVIASGCTADLENNEKVWRVILELSQDIGHKLRGPWPFSSGSENHCQRQYAISQTIPGAVRLCNPKSHGNCD